MSCRYLRGASINGNQAELLLTCIRFVIRLI